MDCHVEAAPKLPLLFGITIKGSETLKMLTTHGSNIFKPSLRQKREEEGKAYECIIEGEDGFLIVLLEWMATIENIKRVLRQLEATGENLEHSSIKSTIGNKFTIMGFGQGICSKRVEVPWSRALLRVEYNSCNTKGQELSEYFHIYGH
ncbi:hypothetical protein DINM_006861 [Dirofilaria immitis]|nr:hypothetical protein [Dirofilaria immitis]